MATPSGLLDRAKRADDLQGLLKQGIGGTLLAIATALISGILTLADVFIMPMQAAAAALGDLVTAILGSPANIIIAGAQATIESLLGPFNVGPFTFALGIGAVLLGLYLVLAFVSEEETSNFVPLIGTGIDIPTPGFTDPEEESGDD